MKKIYTLLFAISFIALSGIAQVKVVEPTDFNTDLNGTEVVVNGTPNDNELDKVLWLIRTDNVMRELKCRKTEVDVLTGTSNVTCWKLCPTTYDMAGANPIAVVSINGIEMVEDLPGADGDTIKSFAAHYKPNGTDGCSLFKYEWFDSSNPNQVVCSVMIRFTHNVNTNCTASIENNAFENLKIFPNPAMDYFTLSFEGAKNTSSMSVKIIDVLGNTIYSKSVLNENNTINTTSFRKGVYFVAVYDESGTILKTEKLIIR